MDDAKQAGRIVGALFLAKLIAGPLENFTLMGPVVAEPGFLVNAAAHPLNLPLAVMLSFLLSLIAIAVMVVAYPVFRRATPMLALWFVALTLVGIGTSMVEGITMMSMQSLSQAYAAANGADPALWEGLRQVVGKARNWAHYTNLLVGGAGLFAMFLVLYRGRLVPRALAAFGLATAVAQMYSISQPFFGGAVNFALLAPIGLSLLLTMAWLLWRGFAVEPPAPR